MQLCNHYWPGPWWSSPVGTYRDTPGTAGPNGGFEWDVGKPHFARAECEEASMQVLDVGWLRCWAAHSAEGDCV